MTPLAAAPNLIQQVYDRILAAIVDQSLAPGLRIRQHELADTLGVSRQPVSHALHLLHRQGLVIESGRKGFAVAPLDGARMSQLYEVRAALDGLAARLAAGRAAIDPTGLKALRARLDAGRAIGAAAPLSRLIKLDLAFHQAIYRLSGNPAIGETATPQWPHLRRSMGAVLMDEPYRALVWAEHEVIARRIEAGDADGAEAAARDHALRAGGSIAARLEEMSKAA